MKKDKSNVLVYVVIFMVALGIGSVGMYYAIRYFKPLNQTVVNKLEKEVTVTDNGIADAVEKLYDAVVVVESYQNGTMVSSGSGFVYKTEGEKSYILTNNHVISGASEVKVKFTNNKTETVKVVGSDEYSDIGVLSIDKDKIIKVAEIGKAADTRLGDTAFVIGTPLASEYSWTVARGIISGKDRLVEVNASNSSVASWVMNVMQTDAAINSGNEELVASITREDITKDEIVEILAKMVSGKEVDDYQGSKLAQASDLAGSDVSLNFNDTAMWKYLKNDLSDEDKTKVSRTFAVDIDLIEVPYTRVDGKEIVIPCVELKEFKDVVRVGKEEVEE